MFLVVLLLAGRAPTLAAATVPEEILEPFKFVKFAPLIAGRVPVRFAAGISPDPVILFPLRSKCHQQRDVSVTRSAEIVR